MWQELPQSTNKPLPFISESKEEILTMLTRIFDVKLHANAHCVNRLYH